MLTTSARDTMPPARISREASRVGSVGHSTQPPFAVTSAGEARLVATTARNGTVTNSTTITRAVALATLVGRLGRSIHAGRVLALLIGRSPVRRAGGQPCWPR